MVYGILRHKVCEGQVGHLVIMVRERQPAVSMYKADILISTGVLDYPDWGLFCCKIHIGRACTQYSSVSPTHICSLPSTTPPQSLTPSPFPPLRSGKHTRVYTRHIDHTFHIHVYTYTVHVRPYIHDVTKDYV